MGTLVTSTVYELKRPVYYTSSTEIMISPPPLSEQIRTLDAAVVRRMENIQFPYYVEHARSEECIGEVIKTGIFGPPPAKNSEEWISLYERIAGMVSATRLGKRRVLKITVTGSNPKAVYRLARALGPAYVTSLQSFLLSSTERMEKFIDQEIRQTELELARYRAVVAELERQEKLSGMAKKIRADANELAEVRRILKENAGPIQGLHRRLQSGEMPRLEEMEMALTSLLGSLPRDLSPSLGGAARDRMEAARAVWAEKWSAFQKKKRVVTRFHPDYAAAALAARNAAAHLVEAVSAWTDVVDRQIDLRLRNLARFQSARTPNLEPLLEGETLAFDPLAVPRYKTEIGVREQLLGELVRKKSELRLKNSGRGDIAQWVRPPVYPPALHGPNLRRGILLGFALGLLVAFAFAFVLESFDQSLKNPRILENRLGKPVLTVIPRFPTKTLSAESEFDRHLVIASEPHSSAAEAYRTLAHKIDTLESRCLVITSTGPQEGKSTTSANLAVALSEMGRKTLIISANLRRPTLHRFFEAKESPGLRDILSRKTSADQSLQKTAFPQLDLLASGTSDLGKINELLSTSRIQELLSSLRERYDFILIDVPPTAPVSDAFHFARVSDAVLFVYMVGRAGELDVQAVLRSLEDVGGRILGIVMNDVRGVGLAYGYGYGYGYGYAYGRDPLYHGYK